MSIPSQFDNFSGLPPSIELQQLVQDIVKPAVAAEAREIQSQGVASKIGQSFTNFLLTFYGPADASVTTAQEIVNLKLFDQLNQLQKLEENDSRLSANWDYDVELLTGIDAAVIMNKDSLIAQKLTVVKTLAQILKTLVQNEELSDERSYELTNRVKNLRSHFESEGRKIRNLSTEYSAAREIFYAVMGPKKNLDPISPHQPSIVESVDPDRLLREEELAKSIAMIQEALQTNRYHGDSLTPLQRDNLLALLQKQYQEQQDILGPRLQILGVRLADAKFHLENLADGERPSDYQIPELQQKIEEAEQQLSTAIWHQQDIDYQRAQNKLHQSEEIRQRQLGADLEIVNAAEKELERGSASAPLTCQQALQRETDQLMLTQRKFDLLTGDMDARIKSASQLKKQLEANLKNILGPPNAAQTARQEEIQRLEREISHLQSEKRAHTVRMNETNVADFKTRMNIIQYAIDNNQSFYSTSAGQTSEARVALLKMLQQQRIALIRLLRLNVNSLQNTLNENSGAANTTPNEIRSRINGLVQEIGLIGIQHSERQDFSERTPITSRERQSLLTHLDRTQRDAMLELAKVIINDFEPQLKETANADEAAVIEQRIASLKNSQLRLQAENLDTKYQLAEANIAVRYPFPTDEEAIGTERMALDAATQMYESSTGHWKTKLDLALQKKSAEQSYYTALFNHLQASLAHKKEQRQRLQAHISQLDEPIVGRDPHIGDQRRQELRSLREQELAQLNVLINQITQQMNNEVRQELSTLDKRSVATTISLIRTELDRANRATSLSPSDENEEELAGHSSANRALITSWQDQLKRGKLALNRRRSLTQEADLEQGKIPELTLAILAAKQYSQDVNRQQLLDQLLFHQSIALEELQTQLERLKASEEPSTEVKEMIAELSAQIIQLKIDYELNVIENNSLKALLKKHLNRPTETEAIMNRRALHAKLSSETPNPAWGQTRELDILKAQIDLEIAHQQLQDNAIHQERIQQRLNAIKQHIPDLKQTLLETPNDLAAPRARLRATIDAQRAEIQQMQTRLERLREEHTSLVTQIATHHQSIAGKTTLLKKMKPVDRLLSDTQLKLPKQFKQNAREILSAHHPVWEIPTWMQFLQSELAGGPEAHAKFIQGLNRDQWQIQEHRAYRAELLNRLQEIKTAPARTAQDVQDKSKRIEDLTQLGNALYSKIRKAEIRFHTRVMQKITAETTRRNGCIDALELKMTAERNAQEPDYDKLGQYSHQISEHRNALAALNKGFHEHQMVKYRAIRPPSDALLQDLREAEGVAQKSVALLKIAASPVLPAEYTSPEQLEVYQAFAAAGYTYEKGIDQVLNTKGENAPQLLFQLVTDFVNWADKRPVLASRLVEHVAMSIQMAGNQNALNTLLAGAKVKMFAQATLGEIGRDVWPLPTVTEDEFKYMALAELFKDAPKFDALVKGASAAWGAYWVSGIPAALAAGLMAGSSTFVKDRAIVNFVNETSPNQLRALNIILQVAQGESASTIMAEQRTLSTWQIAGNTRLAIQHPNSFRQSLTRRFKNTYRVLREAKGWNLAGRIFTSVILPSVLVAGSVAVVTAAIVTTGGLAAILIALGWAALGISGAIALPPILDGFWNFQDPKPLEKLEKHNAEEMLAANKTLRIRLVNQRDQFLGRLTAAGMLPNVTVERGEFEDIVEVMKNPGNPIKQLQDSFKEALSLEIANRRGLQQPPLDPEDVIAAFNKVYKDHGMRDKCKAIAVAMDNHNEIWVDHIEAQVLAPLFQKNKRQVSALSKLMEDDSQAGAMINWLDHGFQNAFLNTVASYQTPEQAMRSIKAKAAEARTQLAAEYKTIVGKRVVDGVLKAGQEDLLARFNREFPPPDEVRPVGRGILRRSRGGRLGNNP